jgi:hypothetical protein
VGLCNHTKLGWVVARPGRLWEDKEGGIGPLICHGILNVNTGSKICTRTIHSGALSNTCLFPRFSKSCFRVSSFHFDLTVVLLSTGCNIFIVTIPSRFAGSKLWSRTLAKNVGQASPVEDSK